MGKQAGRGHAVPYERSLPAGKSLDPERRGISGRRSAKRGCDIATASSFPSESETVRIDLPVWKFVLQLLYATNLFDEDRNMKRPVPHE
ncbi:hypothetical protein EWH08_10705 [Sphingobium indicum]|uniref:Uncharacterized protein n=1 Tax=Sphingobium indicum TaxID=332055 RepID=A0A4Q4J8Q6_9SPHN|nr:hypothetical protein [Sphingobium indicum]NYI22346.1 hypothetical protein [Sphingobium indicum]RYM02649.1 hypothetical protein EWH08_10705 [Sphingobium indicum]